MTPMNNCAQKKVGSERKLQVAFQIAGDIQQIISPHLPATCAGAIRYLEL